MGTATSRPTAGAGIVTVSHRSGGGGAHGSPVVDPDLAALHRLPAVAPLVQPASLAGLFTRADPALPALHARNVNALCREYAALSRHAALPICEEQRALAKKMSGVEALCARVLYLLALRSTELNSSAATLHQFGELRARTGEVHDAVRQAVARAESLEARATQLMLSTTTTTAPFGTATTIPGPADAANPYLNANPNAVEDELVMAMPSDRVGKPRASRSYGALTFE